MTFYPPDAPVPEGLRAAEFLLRPLRESDAALDHDAVMDSRALLLSRSMGQWPREGFTLAENAADLRHHEREHRERVAFTYTVMAPDETRCLGCVYINPLSHLLDRYNVPQAGRMGSWQEEPVTTFWVRPDAVERELDARLVAALRAWFRDEWAFPRMLYGVNRNQTRNIETLERVGLRRLDRFDAAGEPFEVYVYA